MRKKFSLLGLSVELRLRHANDPRNLSLRILTQFNSLTSCRTTVYAQQTTISTISYNQTVDDDPATFKNQLHGEFRVTFLSATFLREEPAFL